MHFNPTPINGAWIIEEERRGDSRGWFARTFCSHEFASRELESSFPQINRSSSSARYTLRGMHYQIAPYEEVKVVTCLQGAVFDVIVDIRPSSPTYRQWYGVELAAGVGKWLYLPRGCAHGFLTLLDDTEVCYLVSTPYTPHAERGIRFDDAAFGIDWPAQPAILSDKDRAWPPFEPAS